MSTYVTEQRKHLHEFFSQHPHEMFSAKDLFGHMGSETVSVSAIYRNLSLLEKDGLVRRTTKNGNRESFFQYTGTEACKEHIHLSCTQCGKTIHLALADSDLLVQDATIHNDFVINRAETVLFGLCGACRKHA